MDSEYNTVLSILHILLKIVLGLPLYFSLGGLPFQRKAL